MASPCCPPGSWGASTTQPSEYTAKGTVEQLTPRLQGYVSRPPNTSSSTSTSSKAVVVVPDIFGIDSGRTRAVCDDLASKLGCLVVLPLLQEAFAGPWPQAWGMPNSPAYNLLWFLPWLYRNNLNKLGPFVDEELMPYLKETAKVDLFAVVSVCWGSTVGAHLSSLDGCVGQLGFHPSYNTLGPSLGPSQDQVLRRVRCPQLYLVGHNDTSFPGCPAQRTIQQEAKQECEIRVFDKQVHGWVIRGDTAIPQVKQDVELALEQAEEFLRRVLAL